MKTFAFRIRTTHGSADGTIEARNEDSARNKLAGIYEGQLADTDGDPLNNAIESIDLELINLELPAQD